MLILTFESSKSQDDISCTNFLLTGKGEFTIFDYSKQIYFWEFSPSSSKERKQDFREFEEMTVKVKII